MEKNLYQEVNESPGDELIRRQGTVAVTGASGHIGNVVCRTLVKSGYKVKAFYNSNKSSLEGLALETIQGNVLDKNDLDRLITGCEVVIHCAAIITIHGDPSGIVFRTNTEGSKNVLEVSKASGVKKLIHVSSVHAVMELPLSTPFNEQRPYKTAASPSYDYSKAIGEQQVREAAKTNGPEMVIVRPSSVIGPYDFKPSQMGKALLDLYNRKIPALPYGGYDFVDVRDVAASVAAAVEKGRHGEIYLLSGKYYTIKDLARIVQKVSGKKVPGLIIPFKLLQLSLPLIALYSRATGAAPLFTRESIWALKNGHPDMDHSKAAKELGHNTTPLEKTIGDFYEWQRSKSAII